MSGPVPTYDVSYLPVNMDPSWDEQRSRQDHAAEPGRQEKGGPFAPWLGRNTRPLTRASREASLSTLLLCSVAFVVSPCSRRSLLHSHHPAREGIPRPGHHRGTCRVQPRRASPDPMPAAARREKARLETGSPSLQHCRSTHTKPWVACDPRRCSDVHLRATVISHRRHQCRPPVYRSPST